MSAIKSELSLKSPYYIPKHRYYELVHYARQYDDWKKAYRECRCYETVRTDGLIFDETGEKGAYLGDLGRNIELLERIAALTSKDLSKWILLSATKGLSYDTLSCTYEIPCSRGSFYQLYRKFWWLLDREKGL